MCGIIGGVIVLTVGAVLTILACVMTFTVIPSVVNSMIEQEVVLISDSEQLERFENIPVDLTFNVRFFNISNSEEVLQGAVPFLDEVGPYTYRLKHSRIIDEFQEDTITYRRLENFEFVSGPSFSHSEDDYVTIANIMYHAILQVAEADSPHLMFILNQFLNGVFGEYNSPIVRVRVRDLLFDGITFCANTNPISAQACNRIRDNAQTSKNIQFHEDDSMTFSVFAFKNGVPSSSYKVLRGLVQSSDLGRIVEFDYSPRLSFWSDRELLEGQTYSECNSLRGTDSGIFPPFVDRQASLYAHNADICRSVELRYDEDVEYEGIPALRYTANEWLLDNHEGCYCVNETRGLTRHNGCLLEGAMELFSCVGAYTVLTYPHFLYADPVYKNGVVGLSPNEEQHRIMLDLEPHTGTILRGAKRAQFNIFLRPIRSITATQNLNTTLTPVFWVEEAMSLPEVYVQELKSKLLSTLDLLQILLPILIAVCCVVLLVGIVLTVVAKRNSNKIEHPK